MSVQKVVLTNANRLKVTKVKSLSPVNFFHAGNEASPIKINRIYDTNLRGDTISVGSHLVTNHIETSTILEIAFCAEKTLQVRTRNSVYSVQIFD